MISALRQAVPYLRLYKGKTFVIKAKATPKLIEQVAILHHLGIRLVFVQAGAPADAQFLETCRALGIDAVGDIVLSDRATLTRELDAGLMPVVSSQADTVAASIGVALVAEKLIFCAGAPGILERRDDPRSLVTYTDLAGLRRLSKSGCLDGGGLPGLSATEAAIQAGVRRVHVISNQAPDSLLLEVFTNEGTGTMIVADVAALTPAELQTEPAVA